MALHAILCNLRCYLSSDDICHGEECVVSGVHLCLLADTHVRVIGIWLPSMLLLDFDSSSKPGLGLSHNIVRT